jgi:butyryl-CoA dehydrogenase
MRLSLARQLHSKLTTAARSANCNAGAALSSRQYTTHSQLPSEHQMVYEMCRKFADEELAPNAGKWDKEHSFPREAIDKLVSFRLMISCLIKYVGLV